MTTGPAIHIPEQALGIRIEDDVPITPTGARYLGTGLPRTADDIEHAMAARKAAPALVKQAAA